MSTTPKKFSDLSPEQQVALKAAGKVLLKKMMFNFLNYGGLIVLANLVIVFANLAIFNSTLLMFCVVVVADISLLRMASNANLEAAKTFKEKFDNIVKA